MLNIRYIPVNLLQPFMGTDQVQSCSMFWQVVLILTALHGSGAILDVHRLFLDASLDHPLGRSKICSRVDRQKCCLSIYGRFTFESHVGSQTLVSLLSLPGEKFGKLASPTLLGSKKKSDNPNHDRWDNEGREFVCRVFIKSSQSSCGEPGIPIGILSDSGTQRLSQILQMLQNNITDRIGNFVHRKLVLDSPSIDKINVRLPPWISHSSHLDFWPEGEAGVALMSSRIIDDFLSVLQQSKGNEITTPLNQLMLSFYFKDGQYSMDFQGSTHPTTLNNNNDKSLDVVDDCVDVEFLDRRMEGTGQHRKLKNSVHVTIPPSTPDLNKIGMSIECAISIIEVLPPEVFVDVDELGHSDFIMNSRIEESQIQNLIQIDRKSHGTVNISRISREALSFMDIEKPAYHSHSTAVLLSYYVQLDPSSLNSLTLQTEIPTHLRYGAPCPSSDLGSVGSQTTEQRKRSKLVDPSIAEDNLKYSTAGCLKNNQYRRFSLSSPIAFVNCGSEMRTEIVDANTPKITIDQPVGTSCHTFSVAIVTGVTVVLGSIVLEDQIQAIIESTTSSFNPTYLNFD